MSADDKESSMLKGLQGGASFYIVKPVSYDDLKDLWQYAVSSRKGKSAAGGDTGSAQAAAPLQRPLKVGSISVAVVQEKPKNRESKKKAQVKKINEANELEKGEATLPIKSKVIWTTALHNEFLEAIRKVGLERAVPKRILEHINEPGLTRENVASHLQKYRIFLKRLMEATNSDGSSNGKNLMEKTLRSSFATGHPSLMINALEEGLKRNIPLSSSFGATIFSNQQASNSNPTPELGHGKSHLWENSACFQQPTFGNNSLYQANNGDITCNYNIADQVGFSNVGVSSDLNGTHDLVYGNIGNMNSGYYSQGGYSARGLGRTPHFSNVSQKQNNPTFSNEGLFDQQTNNTFHGESVFAPQSAESDVYHILLNQPKNSSNAKEGGGEEVENHGHAIGSFHVEQNPFENRQYPNQIESNGGMWGYNTHQLDDYYPSFDPYRNEQQGGGGLLDPAAYDGSPNVNPLWNQGIIGDDITDFVFGPGGYN